MKAKHVLCSLGLLASGLIVASGARGLSYQDNVDVEFTFEPTLSIGLSAQVLKIDNLAPGSSGESNEITVTVNSNNVTGYTLSANVGSATNTSSDLTFDADNAFECLAVGSSVALADFADSTWGYTIDSGTNYSGLADYASGNSTMLKKTISSGDTNIAFKIAAKASGDQIAGNYTNKVNFTVVTNYVPESGSMQEVTSADLALLMPEVGDAAILKDERDGKRYRVAKLADGNYWMTQNLDFDIVAGTTYTNENTDIGWNSETGSYDSASWTPSASTYTTDNTTWNKSKTVLESYNPGNLCWNGVLDADGSTTLAAGTTVCDDSNMNYHIGNYYNWTAAAAMNDSSSYSANNTDVDQSICPAGWMLPKSGATIATSGSFRYLRDRLALVSGLSGNVQNAPVYFPYSGGWVGDGAWGVGNAGYWWSSVVDSADYAYGLYTGVARTLSIRSQSGRDSGLSVRCLLRLERRSIHDLTYMQDFAGLTSTEKTSVLNSMTTNAQYQLRDSRDGKSYYVSKLADGHVWMTQNLDLRLGEQYMYYNSGSTDLTQYGSNGYTSGNGYSCFGTKADCDGGLFVWLPERATLEGSSALSGWVNDENNPYSYKDSGTADPSGSEDEHRLTGNYYNWTAAIASNDSSNFNSSTYSDVSSNPKNSVCPKGWRLPTISDQTGSEDNSTNEFKRLNILYNGGITNDASNLMAAPLYLVQSGYVLSGAVNNAGSGGYYWSSTVFNGSSAYFLYFYSSGVYPGSFNSRSRGFPVRCVAR